MKAFDQDHFGLNLFWDLLDLNKIILSEYAYLNRIIFFSLVLYLIDR